MWKHHTTCRACGSKDLKSVFDLGVQPLANDFVGSADERAGYAPLEVLFCPSCTLAQLSVVVKPEILYEHYSYVTSRSQTMQEHFGALWAAIRQEVNPESLVEIGSNDGHFLQFAKAHGAEAVMGIDPAANLRPNHAETGVMSVCSVFDATSASIARSSMPPVDVIVARHVFAHIDDWKDFITNLDVVAAKETLIVLEVPWVVDLLDTVAFDTIYHEHLSYVAVRAVVELLRHTPFHIHHVTHSTIHGGAIVLMLRRNDSAKKPDEASKMWFVEHENITDETWAKFSEAARHRVYDLQRRVKHKVYEEKQTVCGFGASAKSTVWINACGLTSREISFICDCTPQKQGRLSPGSDILIVPESWLMQEKPDYAVLWAANFEKEIREKQAGWLAGGGEFIIP